MHKFVMHIYSLGYFEVESQIVSRNLSTTVKIPFPQWLKFNLARNSVFS